MADTTAISWTDHTFNPWWGCTAIAPGCDNCYAAAFDKRTGGHYFDVDVKPRLTKPDNWLRPVKWNKQAFAENRRHRVFCGSMMDWCDKDAPAGALDDLWQLIRDTPMLDWQLLTKRATLIEWCLPYDWGEGYPNVWLGVTMEDRKYGYSRVSRLKEIPARVRFVSAEPLLEHLFNAYYYLRTIDWVIIGGESGPGCRDMNPIWAKSLIDDCRCMHIPVWFKQWGGTGKDKGRCLVDGRKFQEWPRNA